MAVQDRATDNDLIESLVKKGHSFSFFQALYLLERYYCKSDKTETNLIIDEKDVRLVSSLSMGFPASDILKVEKVEEADRSCLVMETSLLGIYGSYSPLPAFYTEEILWNDTARIYVKGFLDLFHHRLLSLLYKSWCKYRFHVQFNAGGSDKFSRMMLSLSGLNLSGFEKKESFKSPPVGLLKFSGLITQRPKSASALRNILKSFFSDAAIKIKEFVGRWVDITPDQKTSLGIFNCRLGVDWSLGGRVFDRAGKFRVVVCPQTFGSFLKFLPDEKHFKQLVSIAGLFSPSNLSFDVELKIPTGVPQIPLKSDGGIRLGLTSWLGKISGDKSIVFSST